MATNAIESKKLEKASITIKYIREVRMTEKRLRLVLLNIRCYQCDRIEESRRSAQKRTYEEPKVTDSATYNLVESSTFTVARRSLPASDDYSFFPMPDRRCTLNKKNTYFLPSDSFSH